jgi:hypothetical protein
MRRIRMGWVVAFVVGVVAIVPSAAQAAFDSGSYSHSSAACNSSIDPITHVIYGYTAFYALARAQQQASTGWSGDDSASQFANSSGFCTNLDGESYSACDVCNRDHERYNQTHEQDTLGRYETVGTPHHDRVVFPGCGVIPKHVAESFSGTRNTVMLAMSNHGFAYTWQWWGNTQPQHQCDGSWVSADGWVGWSNIG